MELHIFSLEISLFSVKLQWGVPIEVSTAIYLCVFPSGLLGSCLGSSCVNEGGHLELTQWIEETPS